MASIEQGERGPPPAAPGQCTASPSTGATAEDLIACCRSNLARFKVPRTVVFGPLPKTSTGKVQKYVLRQRAAELNA